MDRQKELLQELQAFAAKCNDEGFEITTPIQQQGSVFRIGVNIVPLTAQAFKEYQESKPTEESSPE
jgi:hypothetical protein